MFPSIDGTSQFSLYKSRELKSEKRNANSLRRRRQERRDETRQTRHEEQQQRSKGGQEATRKGARNEVQDMSTLAEAAVNSTTATPEARDATANTNATSAATGADPNATTANGGTEDPEAADEGDSAAELYKQANIYLAKQTKPVVIPSFAKWFDINTIHQIEKNSLPDFFDPQADSRYKNPEIYKNVRNFIVNTYRLNPIEYLSFTSARRNIAMDVASTMRIYGFLCKWGLINYQIDPKTKSFSMSPQFTGHFQITLDKPTGFALKMEEAESEKETEKEKETNEQEPVLKKQKVTNNITPNVKLNLQLRRNVYDSAEDAFILQDSNTSGASKQVKRVYCSITGNDITETKYHNLKNKSNISLECFENSQFEDYFKSSDYVKLEKTTLNSESKPWSNNEVLLLLEGIEMFGDDWNLIAGHVGSRAKDQCIIKFIQLPIEDTYLFKHISKSSYVEYLKKLKENKSIDFSSLLNTIANANGGANQTTTNTSTTTTTTTTTMTQTQTQFNGNDAIDAFNKQAQVELENQDKLITSILKLSLRKFELKLQGFMNLESRISEQQRHVVTEKENLVLEKMKVKKQCSEIRTELQRAAGLLQNAKTTVAESPETFESALAEAMSFVDRAISEASYDPNAAPSLTSFAQTQGENGDGANGGEPQGAGDADVEMEDAARPVSVVEPKLYSVWSA
jgi:chromatin structure-remodeling complex subunit RSC8